ncbi:carbohydrate kinase family protein [Thiolinea disciformis]|uniref:carbohydrate kinase family protein n=1 Tax=Thiolinea disciformis TaxID=125614 RepID=UPI000368C2C0|nr:carbohydrate kinase [Thiolinea disciformis]
MFVVCGEALFDVFLEHGTKLTETTLKFEARVGGSPFNVAIGLARLDRSVAMLTGLSSDFLGERLMAVLQSEQVATHWITRKPAPTTLGFVQHGEDGVPAYAFYGNGAADRVLAPSDVAAFDLSQISGLHVGSYSLVVDSAAQAYHQLIQQAAGKKLISIDPNIRLNVEPNKAIWRERVADLLPLVDMVKVSDEDIGLLYPDQDPEVVMQDWLGKGLKLLVLTRGSKGASLWSQQARVDIAAPTIKVVDTVGAGDTFQTALIDAVLTLRDASLDAWDKHLTAHTLEKIGRFAATAAAITCSRRGADLPKRAEVEAQLNAS